MEEEGGESAGEEEERGSQGTFLCFWSLPNFTLLTLESPNRAYALGHYCSKLNEP